MRPSTAMRGEPSSLLVVESPSRDLQAHMSRDVSTTLEVTADTLKHVDKDGTCDSSSGATLLPCTPGGSSSSDSSTTTTTATTELNRPVLSEGDRTEAPLQTAVLNGRASTNAAAVIRIPSSVPSTTSSKRRNRHSTSVEQGTSETAAAEARVHATRNVCDEVSVNRTTPLPTAPRKATSTADSVHADHPTSSSSSAANDSNSSMANNPPSVSPPPPVVVVTSAAAAGAGAGPTGTGRRTRPVPSSLRRNSPAFSSPLLQETALSTTASESNGVAESVVNASASTIGHTVPHSEQGELALPNDNRPLPSPSPQLNGPTQSTSSPTLAPPKKGATADCSGEGYSDRFDSVTERATTATRPPPTSGRGGGTSEPQHQQQQERSETTSTTSSAAPVFSGANLVRPRGPKLSSPATSAVGAMMASRRANAHMMRGAASGGGGGGAHGSASSQPPPAVSTSMSSSSLASAARQNSQNDAAAASSSLRTGAAVVPTTTTRGGEAQDSVTSQPLLLSTPSPGPDASPWSGVHRENSSAASAPLSRPPSQAQAPLFPMRPALPPPSTSSTHTLSTSSRVNAVVGGAATALMTTGGSNIHGSRSFEGSITSTVASFTPNASLSGVPHRPSSSSVRSQGGRRVFQRSGVPSLTPFPPSAPHAGGGGGGAAASAAVASSTTSSVAPSFHVIPSHGESADHSLSSLPSVVVSTGSCNGDVVMEGGGSSYDDGGDSREEVAAAWPQPLMPLPSANGGSKADGGASQSTLVAANGEVVALSPFLRQQYRLLQRDVRELCARDRALLLHQRNSGGAASDSAKPLDPLRFEHVRRGSCPVHSKKARAARAAEAERERLRVLQQHHHDLEIIRNGGKERVDPGMKSTAALANSLSKLRAKSSLVRRSSSSGLLPQSSAGNSLPASALTSPIRQPPLSRQSETTPTHRRTGEDGDSSYALLNSPVEREAWHAGKASVYYRTPPRTVLNSPVAAGSVQENGESPGEVDATRAPSSAAYTPNAKAGVGSSMTSLGMLATNVNKNGKKGMTIVVDIVRKRKKKHAGDDAATMNRSSSSSSTSSTSSSSDDDDDDSDASNTRDSGAPNKTTTATTTLTTSSDGRSANGRGSGAGLQRRSQSENNVTAAVTHTGATAAPSYGRLHRSASSTPVLPEQEKGEEDMASGLVEISCTDVTPSKAAGEPLRHTPGPGRNADGSTESKGTTPAKSIRKHRIPYPNSSRRHVCMGTADGVMDLSATIGEEDTVIEKKKTTTPPPTASTAAAAATNGSSTSTPVAQPRRTRGPVTSTPLLLSDDDDDDDWRMDKRNLRVGSAFSNGATRSHTSHPSTGKAGQPARTAAGTAQRRSGNGGDDDSSGCGSSGDESEDVCCTCCPCRQAENFFLLVRQSSNRSSVKEESGGKAVPGATANGVGGRPPLSHSRRLSASASSSSFVDECGGAPVSKRSGVQRGGAPSISSSTNYRGSSTPAHTAEDEVQVEELEEAEASIPAAASSTMSKAESTAKSATAPTTTNGGTTTRAARPVANENDDDDDDEGLVLSVQSFRRASIRRSVEPQN